MKKKFYAHRVEAMYWVDEVKFFDFDVIFVIEWQLSSEFPPLDELQLSSELSDKLEISWVLDVLGFVFVPGDFWFLISDTGPTAWKRFKNLFPESIKSLKKSLNYHIIT